MLLCEKKGVDMIYLKIMFLIIFFIFISPYYAQSEDGNNLLKQCSIAATITKDTTRGELREAMSCIGMLKGIVGLNRFYQIKYKDEAFFCMPEGVTIKQAILIVLKYLKEHPEELHEEETFLVTLAFKNVYPCKK